MISTWPDYEGPIERRADVVVVGSGAGGAPIAHQLADAGLEVVILEEGSYWPTESFTQEAARSIQRLYRNAGTTMMIGKPGIAYQEGRAVGGSTVINGGMCWRTPERILEHWSRQLGIPESAPADMEPYFETVERAIHVAPQDPESLGRANELFVEGARRLGWEPTPNRRNQIHCMGANACIYGCPTGAKQSMLVSYIPRAVAKGADLYANVRVEKVLTKRGRVVGVRGHVVSHRGKRSHPVTIHAPIVVAACGATQTPMLLWRSGLRNRWIGRNLQAHPNAKAVGIYPEPVRLWIGVHQSHQVHTFREEGFLLAIAGVPPGTLGMAIPFVGKEAADLMERYPHMVVGGTLVEDSTRGRIRRGPTGEPLLFYQLTEFDAFRLKRGVAMMAELHFAAGAEAVLTPFRQVPLIHSPDEIPKLFDPGIKLEDIEVMTVHIMGTAALGASPERGAVNPWGESWEVEGLFVADASLFPSPIGVNPQETIMALSVRQAAHILDRRLGALRRRAA